jgi:hypothetical protein
MAELDAGDTALFPDLSAERAALAHARASRAAMIDRYERMLRDGTGAADEITGEYIEVTLIRALEDLAPEDAADFFGRIDNEAGERFRIGRRHIEDGHHEPVVVDWRAPVAAPFYRATLQDPFGLRRRRRYSLKTGELIGYNDEHLDNPNGDEAVAASRPCAGRDRRRPHRRHVRDRCHHPGRTDLVIRSPSTRRCVQGGPAPGRRRWAAPPLPAVRAPLPTDA